jgi:hypothetical protein
MLIKTPLLILLGLLMMEYSVAQKDSSEKQNPFAKTTIIEKDFGDLFRGSRKKN